MNIKTLFCIITVGLLAGCTQPSVTEQSADKTDNSDIYIPYQCHDEGAFSVAYLGNEQAMLKFQEQVYYLTQVQSASGSKYILDDRKSEVFTPITLFTKGRSAILEVGSVTFNDCQIKE